MEEHSFLCRERLHFAEEEVCRGEVIVSGVEAQGGDAVS